MASSLVDEFDVLKVNPNAGLERARTDPGSTPRGGPTAMEDTFWPGKRALVPDYDKILELDGKVMNTPEKLRKNPKGLVDHLSKLASNPVEKYRVLFRWIAAFISFGQRHGRRTSDVSGFRQAIAEGVSAPGVISLAAIFQKMCSLAGLPCKHVSGNVRSSSHYPGTEERSDHTWNVIELSGDHYYCDIAWASGGIVKNEFGKHQTMVRTFREEYFLAEPVQFFSEHLPVQGGEIVGNHQFGAAAFASIEDWSNSLHIGPMVVSLGVEVITEGSILEAEDNAVDAQLRCPRGVRLWHHLRQPEDGEREYDDYVMQLWDDDVVTFRVQLPAKGKYTLTIYGGVDGIKNHGANHQYSVFGVVTTFSVKGDGEVGHPPLPSGLRVYGVLPQAASAGYLCLSHTEPVIETASNRLTFEFARPPGGSIIPNLFHEERPKLKIIDSVYREPFPRKTAFHVALSKPGRYCFEVYARCGPGSQSPVKAVYNLAARFLIICTSQEKASFFADPNPWGPSGEFKENGITCLDISGSTIHATNGKGCITFTSPIAGGKDITYNLLAPGLRGTWKEIPDYKTWIFGEVMERKRGLRYTRFNFRIPERGFYQFLLGYGEKFMGRWLVACPVAHAVDLFPTREGLWGSSRKMAEELGMKCSHPVRLTALDGEVNVTVEIPPKLPDWHVFAHLMDAEGPRLMMQSKDVSRVTDSSRKDWRAVTFGLKLPASVKTAILTLSIGRQKSNGSKVISTTNEGCWLVSRIEDPLRC